MTRITSLPSQYSYEGGITIFNITYPTNTSVTISALKHRVSEEISKRRAESRTQTAYILFEMAARLVISVGISYIFYDFLILVNGSPKGWYVLASVICFLFLCVLFLWILPFLSDAAPIYRLEALVKVWKKLSYIELSLRGLDSADFDNDESVLIKPYDDMGLILKQKNGKEYPVFLPYKAEILSESNGEVMLDLRIYDEYVSKVTSFLDNGTAKVFDVL